MEWTRLTGVSRSASHPCRGCGGPMRLVGSESHLADDDTDLLTYACQSCDQLLVLPAPIEQRTPGSGGRADGSRDDVFPIDFSITSFPQLKADDSHQTPIACDRCGGAAHLIDCCPCAIPATVHDVWTFRCDDCGGFLKRVVDH